MIAYINFSLASYTSNVLSVVFIATIGSSSISTTVKSCSVYHSAVSLRSTTRCSGPIEAICGLIKIGAVGESAVYFKLAWESCSRVRRRITRSSRQCPILIVGRKVPVSRTNRSGNRNKVQRRSTSHSSGPSIVNSISSSITAIS